MNIVSVVLRFHIWFTMTAYYKMCQVFIQNTTILLQKATVITNCHDFYYKIRQLLQNATFVTNCDSLRR